MSSATAIMLSYTLNSRAAMIKLFWLNKLQQMLLQCLMKTRCKIVDYSKGGLISESFFSFGPNLQKILLNHYPEHLLFRWIVLTRVFWEISETKSHLGWRSCWMSHTRLPYCCSLEEAMLYLAHLSFSPSFLLHCIACNNWYLHTA